MREKDGLRITTCEPSHDFLPIDQEISGSSVWEWMDQVRLELVDMSQLEKPVKELKKALIEVQKGGVEKLDIGAD